MKTFAVGISALVLVLPGASFAATATVNTQVLIPQGSAQCQSPVISNVTPYVYSNQLNSFDITVSDPSYVAVLGSAGKTGIPLRYMMRRINPDGSLFYHIDVDATNVNGTLPVTLTMLSSRPSAPTCITVVSFPVQGSSYVTPTPVHTTTHPSTPSKTPVKTHPSTTTSGTSSSSTAATSATPVVGGGLQSVLSRVCNAAGAYQLWFILLALFMVGVGLVAFAEPPLARKSTELPAALIIVPLVLLLLFWYITPACRVAVWIPIVLLVAAALALLAAYREQATGDKAYEKKPLLPATPAPKAGAVIPLGASKSPVPVKTVQTTTVVTPNKAEQTKTTVTPNKIEQTKTTVTPVHPPKDQPKK